MQIRLWWAGAINQSMQKMSRMHDHNTSSLTLIKYKIYEYLGSLFTIKKFLFFAYIERKIFKLQRGNGCM